jgi:peptidyl-prolyl cis-trans isomerase B (cyclophilin B)
MPRSRCALDRRPAVALGALLLAVQVAGCGVEAQDAKGDHTVFRDLRTDLATTAADRTRVDPERFVWPEGEHPHAFLHVEGLGSIEIELYPELAPKTVANFEKLASEGFYDGTTFHRVIPGFMIQGGDPNTRNADPTDDGRGGPGYTIEDEFGKAPHVRGAVSMANTGAPDSGGSQFFIVHQDSQHLDGSYSLFGRVVSGLDVVDRIATVERDAAGRWGPKDRPIEPVEIGRLWVAPAGTAEAFAGARAGEDEVPAPASPAP